MSAHGQPSHCKVVEFPNQLHPINPKGTPLLYLAVLGVVACVLAWAAPPVQAQTAVDGFNPNVAGGVQAVAVQADGKVVLGGSFLMVGGQTRNNIARVNGDGSLDAGFNPGTDLPVSALAVQADGLVLVGGQFNTLGGQPRSNLGRLNPDGSLDLGFNPGVNNLVQALAVQPGGKILVAGYFSMLGGQPCNGIGRLNPNGTFDATFNAGANGGIQAMTVQADGKILLSGSFSQLGGQPRSGMGRLNSDGSLDPGFVPVSSLLPPSTLGMQADGHVVIGGSFTQVGFQPRSGIARLNADGSLDMGFNPGVSGGMFPAVGSLVVQADGKIIVGGMFTSLGGQPRSNLGRLNVDGSVDMGFNPGGGNFIATLLIQPDGKILVGGGLSSLGGQTRNGIGRLYSDGSLDATLNPVISSVAAVAVQPDGKILVGGGTGIIRLNPDGSTDSGFSLPFFGGMAYTLAVQPDGKILVGGQISNLGGQPRTNLGRLNPDGSVDMGFNPAVTGGPFPTVNALAMQSDGKIVVGGFFDTLVGQPRGNIGRLNPDGSVDMGFNPGASGQVFNLTIQPDGKIVAGGQLGILAGHLYGGIGRVNADGSPDLGFNPPFIFSVNTLGLQSNGKIVVGGSFMNPLGPPISGIGRLNPDGSMDGGFNFAALGGTNPFVNSMAVQTDGKIIAGGGFTSLGGQACSNLGRVNADGSPDPNFNAGTDNGVNSLALQTDGKVLVGGFFTQLGGQPRMNFGRLTNPTPASQNLSADALGSTVTWLRDGSSPEVSQVTFEQSTDGIVYTPLGTGSPTVGGWQLTGLNLPSGINLFIRARGYFSTGAATGSGSLVESVRNVFYPCPTITAAVSGGGPICLGSSSTVTVTVTGGQAPYTVTLTNGGGTQTGAGPTFNFMVSPAATTTYMLQSGSDTKTCLMTGSGSATVTVSQPPSASNAGSPQTLCLPGPANLFATPPTSGSGLWSVAAAPPGGSTSSAQITFPNSFSTPFTPNPSVAGTYTLQWTVSSGACPPSISTVAITFNAPPTPANAGPPQTLCLPGPATLAANNPTVGMGTWSVVSGPSTSVAQFGNVNFNNTTFTPAGGAGTYTLRWTISNAPCTASSSTVAITFNASPTPASAGPPQTLCLPGPATLAGNNPTVGTGTWSVVSGPSTLVSQFGNVNVNNTSFTPAGGAGTYTLLWTISNAPCTASSSTVAITFTPATAITTQPVNQLVPLNQTATFTVNSSGTQPLNYQWFYDADCNGPGAPVAVNNGDRGGRVVISGSPTSSTLTINNIQLSDSGCYRVVVSGPCGTVPSNTVTLSVSAGELNVVYVADTNNHRIQKYTAGSGWSVLGSPGPGTGLGQFTLPEAVSADLTGMKIYVADTGNSRIQYSLDGGISWANFAVTGNALNQVRSPQGLALDMAGNLYVSDTGNNRLLRFNGGVPGTATLLASAGTTPGFVNNPRGLAIDVSNNLYEADYSTNRIQKFANAGGTPTATVVAGPGSGLFPGQVLHPEGVAVTNTGNLYVADTGNQRILLFPGGATGAATLVCGTGSVLGQVKVAEGVTVCQGTVLGGAPGTSALIVSDTGNNRIEGSLTPMTPGSYVQLGGPGSGPGQFNNPGKIR